MNRQHVLDVGQNQLLVLLLMVQTDVNGLHDIVRETTGRQQVLHVPINVLPVVSDSVPDLAVRAVRDVDG